MAKTNKKQKKPAADFRTLQKQLKEDGPERLYLLYGEEDYLREAFYEEIVKLCAGENAEFNHRRLNGESLNLTELSEAVNALPFFAERTLVELRNFEINKCREDQAEELSAILSDIPDYCTVVLILPTDYKPDSRLSAVKTVRKLGREIEFSRQEQSALVNWVIRHFQALGKGIARADAEYLIFVSGSLMNRLLPEIQKCALYAKGDAVTREDIDAVAHHLPEARVFEMTEQLSRRNFDGAFAILAELLQMRDQSPIMILAVIGKQMRNLLAARVAVERRLGMEFVMETCAIRQEFVAERLLRAARGFSLEQLRGAVRLCAETDYRMKTSSGDETELLRELLLRIAAGDAA